MTSDFVIICVISTVLAIGGNAVQDWGKFKKDCAYLGISLISAIVTIAALAGILYMVLHYTGAAIVVGAIIIAFAIVINMRL